MPLIIEPNLPAPDAFYQTLIETHQGLTDEQSAEVNAAVILLLANHVGDMEIIRDVLSRARRSVLPQSE